MQQQIRSQFLPLNYEGIIFQQYQALQHGQCLVQEYTNEFYKMQTRVQLTATKVQVIHRYLMGLRPNDRNLVELQPCWTLFGVVQLAMKVESQQRRSNNHPIRSVRGHRVPYEGSFQVFLIFASFCLRLGGTGLCFFFTFLWGEGGFDRGRGGS